MACLFCVMFNGCVIVRVLSVVVCFVCDVLCDVVWCVFICVVLCLRALFVVYCVMLYGVCLRLLCLCVTC